MGQSTVDVVDAFAPAVYWSTGRGEFATSGHSGPGYRHTCVMQRVAGRWVNVETFDDTRFDNPMLAHDEWRMCVAGYEMTHPYPAWEKVHGAARTWSEVDRDALQNAHPLVERMLDWLKELAFSNAPDMDALEPREVVAAVARHYEGGVAAFERDSQL